MKEKTCYKLIHQFLAFLQELPPQDVASLESGAKTIKISLSKSPKTTRVQFSKRLR
jgi:hypothetical protein